MPLCAARVFQFVLSVQHQGSQLFVTDVNRVFAPAALVSAAPAAIASDRRDVFVGEILADPHQAAIARPAHRRAVLGSRGLARECTLLSTPAMPRVVIVRPLFALKNNDPLAHVMVIGAAACERHLFPLRAVRTDAHSDTPQQKQSAPWCIGIASRPPLVNPRLRVGHCHWHCRPALSWAVVAASISPAVFLATQPKQPHFTRGRTVKRSVAMPPAQPLVTLRRPWRPVSAASFQRSGHPSPIRPRSDIMVNVLK